MTQGVIARKAKLVDAVTSPQCFICHIIEMHLINWKYILDVINRTVEMIISQRCNTLVSEEWYEKAASVYQDCPNYTDKK